MQAVVVARLVFGAEVYVFAFFIRECFMSCCLILILLLVVGYIGAASATPRSLSHTLQTMTLATKVALRSLHLWFIFRI